MNSKKRFQKICLIIIVALLIIFSLSSCKKREKDESAVANPSALVNQEKVINSASNTSSQSLVSVPLPEMVVEKADTIKEEVVESIPEVPSNKITEVFTNVVEPKEETKIEVPSAPQTPSFLAHDDKSIVEVETEEPVVITLTPQLSTPVIIEEEQLSDHDDKVKDANISDIFNFGVFSGSVTSNPEVTIISFTDPYPSVTFVDKVLGEVVAKYPTTIETTVYEFDGKTLTITYPYGTYGDSKDSLYNTLNELSAIVISTLESEEDKPFECKKDYLLYGKEVTITAGKDKAVITSLVPFTSNEINEAIEILRANFPEESKYVTYTLLEDRIELSYPEQNPDYIEVALDQLNDLILAYTPMPLVTYEDNDVLSDIPDQEKADTETVDSVLETNINTEPITKAVFTLQNLSVGASLKGGYNFSYPSNPFTMGFDVRGEYKINDSFGIGIKAGYDSNGYIPLKAYVKYNFHKPEGLYVFGGMGVAIKTGDRKNGFILDAGIGYEFDILTNTKIFGEAGLTFETQLDKKVNPYISIGARYSF